MNVCMYVCMLVLSYTLSTTDQRGRFAGWIWFIYAGMYVLVRKELVYIITYVCPDISAH